MTDFTKQMKDDLLNELATDALRFSDRLQQLRSGFVGATPYRYTYSLYDLNQLEYITAQMRLKLRLLGVGQIWEEEQHT